MPRFRALFLLGLFGLNQAACTSWQVPKVTPQEYVAQHPDSIATGATVDGQPTYERRSDPMRIRIMLKSEQGKPPAKVVLTGTRFTGDSVFGRDPQRQTIGYGLQQVARFEVRRPDGGRTLLMGLGLGLLVLVAGGLISCATTESIAC